MTTSTAIRRQRRYNPGRLIDIDKIEKQWTAECERMTAMGLFTPGWCFKRLLELLDDAPDMRV